MSIFIDETYEEQQSRENLEQFYGQFSADVRKKLLSKNIKSPQNLYDVLYTPIRKELLSKNVPTSISIDKTSAQIRNSLLAKQIEKDINLDKTGENIRKSLLAKNELIQTSVDIEGIAESSRKLLVPKNAPNKANPESGSEEIRNGLESKNVHKDSELDTNSSVVRDNLLSKNDSNENNIDQASASQRQNLLSKNTSNGIGTGTSPEKGADTVRKDLLSSNISKNVNLENVASTVRKNLLSSNVSNGANPDDNADVVRKNLLSSNAPIKSSPENGADTVRKNLLSSNKTSTIGPDTASSNTVREDLLSSNVSNGASPDNGANTIRKDLLSSNKKSTASPDNGADTVRKDLLSSNVSNDSGIGTSPDTAISDTVRKDLLSSNKSNGATPDTAASDVARKNLLSNNKSNGANPETVANTIRKDLISSNVSNGANPEFGSEIIRKDLLASNVSNGASPETGSKDLRDNLSSKNVSSDKSPETGSKKLRDTLISKNTSNGASPDFGANDVRDNLVSKNVPSVFNIETGAEITRNDLLIKNIPNGANPETGADDERNDLLSKNNPINSNIDLVANKRRDDLLSNNIHNDTNIDELATTARNSNLSKNSLRTSSNSQLDGISNPFRHNLLSKNGHDTPLGANIIIPNGTSQFIGISNLDVLGEIVRDSNKLVNLIFKDNTAKNLQQFYGTEINQDKFTPLASITSAAQLHNIENNTFALHRYSQGSSVGIDALSRFNNNGFQDLIQKTIGSFQKYTQIETNSTPASVIQENRGQYLRKGPEEMLNVKDGFASTYVSQTEPSDIIETNFNKQDRGIRHIMNKIKNSSITLAENYDPQNNRSFVIGTNASTGGLKRAFGRFTIANPYRAPSETSVMELRITNYSINNGNTRTMSFPPYIKSFQHSDSSSWNETLFLGRPEPIYTYSNSKRSGTIEFIILTDFAQSVDIGVNFEQGTTITETFENHFTDGENKISQKNNIQARLQKETNKLNELTAKKSQLIGTDTGSVADLNKQISDQQKAIISIQERLDAIDSAGSSRLFSEGTKDGGNIYQSILDGDGKETDRFDGTITTRPADTIKKLDEMKSKLLFQPAFFSGDKVDFLRRMEFIAKLTRPSRNQGSGFSFSTPPVCHLHLGDWINSDIIIESVNYDYSDSPWLSDFGKTQPMFCSVTISFTMVGGFGANKNEDVPLSSDSGGFFSRRTSI